MATLPNLRWVGQKTNGTSVGPLQTWGRLTASRFPETNAGRLPFSPGVAAHVLRLLWPSPLADSPRPGPGSSFQTTLLSGLKNPPPCASQQPPRRMAPRSYPVLNVPFRRNFTQPNLQSMRVIPSSFLITGVVRDRGASHGNLASSPVPDNPYYPKVCRDHSHNF